MNSHCTFCENKTGYTFECMHIYTNVTKNDAFFAHLDCIFEKEIHGKKGSIFLREKCGCFVNYCDLMSPPCSKVPFDSEVYAEERIKTLKNHVCPNK